MSLLAQRYVLGIAEESTYNQNANPTGANAVLCQGLAPTRPTETLDRNELGDPSLSPFRPIHGRAIGEIAFDVELKGSGTNDVAPEWVAPLEACGFNAIVNTSVDVTINPASPPIKSVTVYAWRDGIRYAMTGCRGNVVFRFPAGQRPMMSFTLRGHLTTPPAVDEAMPSPTLDAVTPVSVRSMLFSVGGFAGVVAALDLDMGNQVASPDDINSPDGYGEIQIVDRNPQGTVNPEATLVATQDWLSKWQGGDLEAANFTLNGGAGNTLAFNIPGFTYRSMDDADRSGILAYDVGFSAARINGDDEFQIVHT